MKNKLQIALVKPDPFSVKGLIEFGFRNSIFSHWIFILVLTLVLSASGKSYAQVSESFNSGIPSSWSIVSNNVGTSNWETTTDGFLNTNGVYVRPSADNIGDQNTAEYFLVTPQFTVPEKGEIHFYTKQSSEIDHGATYEVRISTAAQPDITAFGVTLQSYTESNLNNVSQTAYEKKVIKFPSSVPAGLNVYIAFVATNTQNGDNPTGDSWFIDDVEILEGCLGEISDVEVDNIMTTTANLSWTHPSATNFELQILPKGGVPATSGFPVSGTSYSLINLDEETEYVFYISPVCDNGIKGEWAGPYSFETLKLGLTCVEPIVLEDIGTNPYELVENLQNYVHPNPAEVSYTTVGTNCVPGGSTSTTNYLNGDKIFHTYTPTEDGLLSISLETGTEGGGGDDNCYNSRISLFVYEDCSGVGTDCLAGFTINNAFSPKSIENLFVEQGKTYVIVVSSELSSGAGICFKLNVSGLTCAPPGNFDYSDLTENSVKFSWGNVGGFSDSWEYQVVARDAGTPTAGGTPTSTNTDVVINSGLTPGTDYDLYVRSVCGGLPGAWSKPYAFTTQCTAFDTPYFTDFNGANVTPEPCWTSLDINKDGNTWGYLGAAETYATIVTELNRVNGISNDMLVSPQINFDASQKRIRYKHRATQGASVYSIRLSTTGIGPNNFTTEILPVTRITNTAFQEVIVDIPEGITGKVNIAWYVEPSANEDALRLSIDDVYIEDKPSCPKPLNPSSLNVKTDSAWLTWTKGDEETQWQVAIQDAGTGIPTGDGVIVDSNFPYAATGLEPGTRYEYYVRAHCADDDQSVWVGPATFTTLCTSYDTPFYESFNEVDPDTQKFCWDTSDDSWSVTDTRAETSSRSTDAYLISPAINIDGVQELKFKYRAEVGFYLGVVIPPRYGLEVLMSTTTNNPTSFSVISQAEVFTHSNYIEKSIIIEANGPVYIAFRVPSFSGGSSTLHIDDVSIGDPPPCPVPGNLSLDTVTSNSVDFSWTAGYQETSWQVAVQFAGVGVPNHEGVTSTETTFSATDLNPDTDYEVYVKSNCGDDNSEWIGPLYFSTTCTAFPSPFVETFNTDSTTEGCWTVIDDNYDLDTWELDSATFPYEGDQAAAMFTGHNGRNEDWLISPTITLTENQQLRYYYRVNDSFFTEDLEVLLSTNGVGLDQFTHVLYDSDDDPVIINNVEYKVKIISLAGYVGDVNIAFHVPFFASTGAYRGQTLVIDNFNIEDIPDCPEVTNVIASNLSDTQLDLSWDDNGETSWEISVQPSGTEAPVGSANPDYLYDATSNPFTVTGLTASSKYDVYVRSTCDADGPWTGPLEVTTLCSFENLCQYTILLTSDTDISSELVLTQNNQSYQSLPFNGNVEESFLVNLCSGVQYSLYFDTVGWNDEQYANYQFEILDPDGNSVYKSPEGLASRTTVYTGYSSCGDITCPEPKDLASNELSTLSWTAAGSETQWEVAFQPIGNGTIPQSGTIVSNSSYTPTASDFVDPNIATYEFFVRAVCGDDDLSNWAGPLVFVRNDDVSTAVDVMVSADEICSTPMKEISFKNVTTSPEAMSCEGDNNGDVWFSFTAQSKIHQIVAHYTTGTFRETGYADYSELVMTLYRENSAGGLEEIICSYDNTITAMYASELVVGDTYKVRLTKVHAEPTEYRLSLCITTPNDLCDVKIVNGGFEHPGIGRLSGVSSILSVNSIPGWRQNLDTTNSAFVWESLNAPGFSPYEGGQLIQLRSDQGTTIDQNDPNIKGLYRDFDTSEITLMTYSFAHYGRFDGNKIQMYAGAPGGPYTLVTENFAEQAWKVISGEYAVPTGQPVTRFIFRANGTDNIGNLLDAIEFGSNNEIITAPFDVDCTNPMATLEARGTGTWIQSDTNPSPVTFDDENNSTVNITNFLAPGVYSFTWKTRYCEYSIELNYNGIGDIPSVETPIEYCINDTPVALEAMPLTGYEIVWFTQATGGTASTMAPTPNTTVAGNTSYYVAYRDITKGCDGPRAEIVVIVNDFIEFEIAGECQEGDYILEALPINSDFDGSQATYTWKDADGNVVGENSEIFNITEYTSQNTTSSLLFSVEVAYGGCSSEVTHIAERSSCIDIPRGISPDGNGKNDDLDLTGYGVTELYIFNRNGTEVYKFKGTYTNQWHGQTNKGENLPDGTYFYSVVNGDGSKTTGWIFINRIQ
ncbi:choice-of-anchor J domain-containing protein [Pseudotamlana agarivorans]|uniref:choice-of-anchor J domain-containing protein n=1 Tax=Pseudotamlana agarivorans TaxID=481183 RepID=UPI000833211E|nr:choice-of-anchor J domain-containing protein [Tamlana agarivorans]